MDERRKAFTQTTKFAHAGQMSNIKDGKTKKLLDGERHLGHVLREKEAMVRKDLPTDAEGKPLIDIVYGDRSAIENQETGKQKKAKYMYYEIMTYAKTDDEINKVKDYLLKKYEGHNLLIVRHL